MFIFFSNAVSPATKFCRSFFVFRLSVIYALILFPVLLSAQAGQWTWMHGQQGTGNAATYGTQGMPDSANSPAGLYEPCQWTDLNGKLWLFGGVDSYTLTNNDLWQYDPAINKWTWVKGTQVAFDPGSYGTKGVPSLSNNPSARGFGVATWTDKQNNLWLFGGGTGSQTSYNDLWKFDITNNEWTWINGPDTTGNNGHYGTQGIPDTLNLPPNRAETAATWVDSSGDLWLFGGQEFVAGGPTYNDLWRYNIASNTWTWMKGSTLKNRPSTFGTMFIENAANTPGGRNIYAHLKDSHDNLWLFGGIRPPGTLLNDIWRYNPVTNNWAWVGGSKTGNAKGAYGTNCVADSNNIPASLFENRACWTDKDGNLWFYGGFLSYSASMPDVSDQLWKYCIQTDKWTLENGDTIPNQYGTYGTMGVSSPTNKPDARGGSVSWVDSAGNLYLFGGSGHYFPNSYSDLWKYVIDTNCAPCASVILPVANFLASDTILCGGNCIDFTNLSVNATTWSWKFAGGIPDTSSLPAPPAVCYYNSGNYDVTLVATNYKGSNAYTLHNYIYVPPALPPPTINRAGSDTLYCTTDTDYVSYQWYADTMLVPGATDTMIVIDHGGNWNVKVTDKYGCNIAVGINVVGIHEYSSNDLQFSVYPNPTENNLQLAIVNRQNEYRNLQINIIDVLGQVCQQSAINPDASGQSAIKIDVSSLPPGIYFIRISNEEGEWIGRFVKE